jgi:Protein of unknown function (DUF2652)
VSVPRPCRCGIFAAADKVDGSVLQDTIESAYFAFRKRLRDIKMASACKCSACGKMQDLDLKFVSHHGEFIKHRTARNSLRVSFLPSTRWR